MNLQPRSEQITVQEEFLWQTAGKVHKVGNVTLDGAAWEGLVKAGTIVAVGANDLAIPYAASTADGVTEVNGMVYVTTNDVTVGDQNVQVGALEEAFLNRARITGATDRLEIDSNYRFKVRG